MMRDSQAAAENGAPGEAFLAPFTASSGKRSRVAGAVNVNQSAPLVVSDDGDPFALLYTTPVHQPPSLAHRTHGTESLFQYYALRGQKELLYNPNFGDAAKATQACLDVGKATPEGAASGSASPQRLANSKDKSLHPSHRVDRCLVRADTASPIYPVTNPGRASQRSGRGATVPLYVPLRPAQAQDSYSVYRKQQADEVRVEDERRRREQLRQPPEAAVYLSRYYPESSTVVADVRHQLVDEKFDGGSLTAVPVSKNTRRFSNSTFTASPIPANPVAQGRSTSFSPTLPPLQQSPTQGRSVSGTGAPRLPTGKKDSSVYIPLSSSLLLLRAPEEVTESIHAQQECRRAMAQQVEDAFVAAYQLRHPEVVKRESMQAGRMSSAEAPNTRASTAISRQSSAKKSRKSMVAAAPPKLEGGVPPNLELFRSSLLLLCNEDGAVTLDQLRDMLSDVPFRATSAHARSSSVVSRFLQIVNPTTHGSNATDATELLLAVASATAGNAMAPGRHTNAAGDNSFSAAHAAGNSARSSNVNMSGRRGPRASVSTIANSRTLPSSTSGQFRGSTSPLPPGSSAPGGANPTSPQQQQLWASGGNWADPGASLASKSIHHGKVSLEPHDGRRSIPALEVLDALDTLLNSPETRGIVRWESFAVLAEEGKGYIHKAQLVALRQTECSEGSEAEMQMPVTAAMVKALGDTFAIVAKEEEAAYLKANKKGKKKSAAPVLAPHQSSPIPLHVMRKSHLDFATFSRFFDELPLMAAAFAHVWLPLLVTGRRRYGIRKGGATTDDPASPMSADEGRFSPAASQPWGGASGAGATLGSTKTSVVLPRPEEGEDPEERGEEALSRPPQPASATILDDDPNASPLEQLGSTPDARVAAVQSLILVRQDQLHQACEAMEEQKLLLLHSDGGNSGGAFKEGPPPSGDTA